MNPLHAVRLQAIQERLRTRNLTAWILSPSPNFVYVTGWDCSPSERLVLAAFPREGEPFLVVPHFEAERARQEAGVERVFAYRDESGPGPALARAFGRWGLETTHLGADFASMRLFERAAVESVVPRARWHDIGSELAQVRMIKDAEEVACLEQAARIATEALEVGRQRLAPGVREHEVRRAIELALLERDSYSPFGVHVASGPRSAVPHATTSERALASGDLVWIDLGAVYRGYCADITRTFAVGPIDPELRRAWEVVQAAQEAARQQIRPGVACEAIDQTARRTISAAGFGAFFTHRTGHGLGLDVHEAPYIVDGNVEPLRPGMVFTVEPGVYLPGKGGVRIEDDVLVTADGCRCLTEYPRFWLER